MLGFNAGMSRGFCVEGSSAEGGFAAVLGPGVFSEELYSGANQAI